MVGLEGVLSPSFRSRGGIPVDRDMLSVILVGVIWGRLLPGCRKGSLCSCRGAMAGSRAVKVEGIHSCAYSEELCTGMGD